MDANDDLPELETASLEDLDLPLELEIPQTETPQPVLQAEPPPSAPLSPPPTLQALSNPFDEPLPAAPPAPASKSESLSMDDLGGDDFDLPMAPPSASSGGGIQSKPIVPTSPPPQAKPLAAPSFGGFKPATPAFAVGGAPKPFGSAPQPIMQQPILQAPPVRSIAPAPRPAEPLMDAKSFFGDASEPTATTEASALRAMLTDDEMPTSVPPEAGRLAFQLIRVLIKKGVITPDDLL